MPVSRRASAVKIGGAMGIAASFIGLGVFFVGLFGFNAVFMLSILPILLGGIGMVLSIVGATIHQPSGDEETQPISALFCCLAGLLFGLIELSIWCALSSPAPVKG